MIGAKNGQTVPKSIMLSLGRKNASNETPTPWWWMVRSRASCISVQGSFVLIWVSLCQDRHCKCSRNYWTQLSSILNPKEAQSRDLPVKLLGLQVIPALLIWVRVFSSSPNGLLLGIQTIFAIGFGILAILSKFFYFGWYVLMLVWHFGVFVGWLVYKGWSREVALWFFMVFAARRGCSKVVLHSLQGEHFFQKTCQKHVFATKSIQIGPKLISSMPRDWILARISNFASKPNPNFKIGLKVGIAWNSKNISLRASPRNLHNRHSDQLWLVSFCR